MDNPTTNIFPSPSGSGNSYTPLDWQNQTILADITKTSNYAITDQRNILHFDIESQLNDNFNLDNKDIGNSDTCTNNIYLSIYNADETYIYFLFSLQTAFIKC
jgi:hypothetical protein